MEAKKRYYVSLVYLFRYAVKRFVRIYNDLFRRCNLLKVLYGCDHIINKEHPSDGIKGIVSPASR